MLCVLYPVQNGDASMNEKLKFESQPLLPFIQKTAFKSKSVHPLGVCLEHDIVGFFGFVFFSPHSETKKQRKQNTHYFNMSCSTSGKQTQFSKTATDSPRQKADMCLQRKTSCAATQEPEEPRIGNLIEPCDLQRKT